MNACPMIYLSIHGHKLFETANGKEFQVKGVAYYPRPNKGKLDVAGKFVDLANKLLGIIFLQNVVVNIAVMNHVPFIAIIV